MDLDVEGFQTAYDAQLGSQGADQEGKRISGAPHAPGRPLAAAVKTMDREDSSSR